MVIALLCLTGEFCFRIVKGFINIKLSLFCDLRCWAEGCYGSAQCDGCALTCCVNMKYSESRDPHRGASTALNMHLTYELWHYTET